MMMLMMIRDEYDSWGENESESESMKKKKYKREIKR